MRSLHAARICVPRDSSASRREVCVFTLVTHIRRLRPSLQAWRWWRAPTTAHHSPHPNPTSDTLLRGSSAMRTMAASRCRLVSARSSSRTWSTLAQPGARAAHGGDAERRRLRRDQQPAEPTIPPSESSACATPTATDAPTSSRSSAPALAEAASRGDRASLLLRRERSRASVRDCRPDSSRPTGEPEVVVSGCRTPATTSARRVVLADRQHAVRQHRLGVERLSGRQPAGAVARRVPVSRAAHSRRRVAFDATRHESDAERAASATRPACATWSRSR